MNGSGAYAHSSLASETSPPANIRNCTVSFDASCLLRGHFSNQGFSAAIDSQFGKVLDYQLYDRVGHLCSKWNEDRKESNPEDQCIWDSH